MLRQWCDSIEHSEDFVSCDVLKQSRCHNEALQGLAQRRDDDANVRRVWKWIPNNLLYQVLTRTTSKSTMMIISVGMVSMIFLALQVAVVCNTAPKDKEGRVHEKTEDDCSKCTILDVSWRIFEDVCSICTAEDTGKAWEENAQNHSEVGVFIVVGTPILLESLPTDPCHPWICHRCLSEWSCGNTSIVRCHGIENNQHEENAKFGDKGGASPDRQN
mmetsp:Transcript_1167/g.1787  ORF Transcript_1167/g.1787 Transcript_1167/m.1787 type:complete len:217 (+) Transcript_1167:1140-1790(+)